MSDFGGDDEEYDDLNDRTGGKYDPDHLPVDTRHRLSSSITDAIDLDVFPVPENTLGDVFLSLVIAVDAQNSRHAHRRLWICASFFLYLLSLFGQFLLSFALFATTIEQEQARFSNGRVESMTAALQKAVQTVTPITEEEIKYLCERSDITVVPAYVVMLSIWFLRMLDQLFISVWFVIVTQRVMLDTEFENDSDDSRSLDQTNLREGDKLIHSFDIESEKFWQIRRTTPQVRLSCLLLAAPRLAMELWIMWVGAKFLVFSHKTKDLILKALVCSFFLQVEHLIYHSLLADAKKRRMKHTTIFFKPLRSEDWSYYGSTVTRLGLAGMLVSVIWFGVFGKIRAFRYCCREYEKLFPRTDGIQANSLAWLIF